MSNINKEQTQLKKDEIFRTETKQELNTKLNAGKDQSPIQRSKSNKDLPSDKSKKNIEDKLEQSRANKEYLDRVIENSNRKNIAMRVRQDQKLSADGFVNVASDKTRTFRQQYPSAVKDKFFGSTEKDKIARYKREFRNADLNTARELPALEKFMKSKTFTSGVVKDSAKDEIFDKELDEYVTYLVNYSIDSRQLTED